eukprot:gene10457-11582_t
MAAFTRQNYYKDLAADYSKPVPVSEKQQKEFINKAIFYDSLRDATLPDINDQYTSTQIEKENKEWWPTHCESLRQGRSDILNAEYREELVYFCQDGPYYGTNSQADREKHWWALLAQPGVIMTWPIVLFHSEIVHFEWACMDKETHETTAKGTVCWIRRGHRGGCHFKSEQLTFYRDVYAPQNLLDLVK